MLRLRPIIDILIASIVMTMLASFALPVAAQDDARRSDVSPKEKKLRSRYERVLLANPTRGTAFQRLRRSYIDHEGSTAWIARLDALMQSGTDDRKGSAAALVLGFAKEADRDFEGAAAAYEVAVTRDATSHKAWAASARLQARRSLLDDAVESFEKCLAIELPPHERQPLQTELARLHDRNGNREKAHAIWSDLVDRFPDEIDLRREFAELLVRDGSLADAVGQFEAVVERTRDPSTRVRARLEIADLLATNGDDAGANNVYHELLDSLAPESWLRGEVLRRVETSYRKRWDTIGLTAFYAKRLERRPNDVEIELALCKLLEDRGHPDELEKRLRDALERTPKSRDLRTFLARTLARGGRMREAEVEWRTLAEAHPEQAEYWQELGRAIIGDRRRDPNDDDNDDEARARREHAARAAWRHIFTERPLDVTRAVRTAEIFRAYTMIDDAIAHYRKAIELTPNDPVVYEYLATYYHELERRDDAIAVLDEMIADRRATGKNRLGLVLLLKSFGYTEAFVAAIDHTLDAGVDRPIAFELLALKTKFMLDEKRHEELYRVLDDFEDKARSRKERRQVMDARIEHALGARVIEEIVADFDLLMQEGGRDRPWDYEYAGRLKQAAGEERAAVVTVREGIEAWPDDVELLTFAADFFLETQDMKEAVKVLQRLVTLEPHREARHLERLVDVHLAARNLPAAVIAGKRLIKVAPDDSTGYRITSRILWQAKRQDAAISILRDGVRRLPKNIELHWQLAQRQFETSDTDGGFEHASRAIELTERPDLKTSLALSLLRRYDGKERHRRTVVRVAESLLPHAADPRLGQSERDELAHDLSTIAATKGIASGVAARLHRAARRLTTNAVVRQKATIAILGNLLDVPATSASQLLEEYARLVPAASHTGSDNDISTKQRIAAYDRTAEFLFTHTIPESRDSTKPTPTEPVTSDRGSPVLEIVRRVVAAGLDTRLERIVSSGIGDDVWARRIGRPTRIVLALEDKDIDVDRLRADVDSLASADPTGVDHVVPAMISSLATAMARRPETIMLAADLADRHLPAILEAPQLYRSQIDLLAIIARASAKAGYRTRAAKFYAKTFNLQPKRSTRRGGKVVWVPSRRPPRKDYADKAPYLLDALDQGIWNEPLAAVFGLVDREAATGGDMAFWQGVFADWRSRARAWSGLAAAIEEDRHELGSPRPDGVILRRLLFFARATGDRKFIDEITATLGAVTTLPRGDTIGLARGLFAVDHRSTARHLLLDNLVVGNPNAPTSTSTGTGPVLPTRMTVASGYLRWFDDDDLVELLEARCPSDETSRSMRQEEAWWFAALMPSLAPRIRSWSPRRRRRFHRVASRIYERADDKFAGEPFTQPSGPFASSRIHSLEALGRHDEAYRLLADLIAPMAPDPKGATRVGRAFAPQRSTRSGRPALPAWDLVRLAHATASTADLGERIQSSWSAGGKRRDAAVALLVLLAFETSDVDTADSLVAAIEKEADQRARVDKQRPRRFGFDERTHNRKRAAGMLAAMAARRPALRGLARRLLESVQVSGKGPTSAAEVARSLQLAALDAPSTAATGSENLLTLRRPDLALLLEGDRQTKWTLRHYAAALKTPVPLFVGGRDTVAWLPWTPRRDVEMLREAYVDHRRRLDDIVARRLGDGVTAEIDTETDSLEGGASPAGHPDFWTVTLAARDLIQGRLDEALRKTESLGPRTHARDDFTGLLLAAASRSLDADPERHGVVRVVDVAFSNRPQAFVGCEDEFVDLHVRADRKFTVNPRRLAAERRQRITPILRRLATAFRGRGRLDDARHIELLLVRELGDITGLHRLLDDVVRDPSVDENGAIKQLVTKLLTAETTATSSLRPLTEVDLRRVVDKVTGRRLGDSVADFVVQADSTDAIRAFVNRPVADGAFVDDGVLRLRLRVRLEQRDRSDNPDAAKASFARWLDHVRKTAPHRLDDADFLLAGLELAAEVGVAFDMVETLRNRLLATHAGWTRDHSLALARVDYAFGRDADARRRIVDELANVASMSGDGSRRHLDEIARLVRRHTDVDAMFTVLDDIEHRSAAVAARLASRLARGSTRLRPPGLAFVARRHGESEVRFTWQLHDGLPAHASESGLPTNTDLAAWSVTVPFVAPESAHDVTGYTVRIETTSDGQKFNVIDTISADGESVDARGYATATRTFAGTARTFARGVLSKDDRVVATSAYVMLPAPPSTSRIASDDDQTIADDQAVEARGTDALGGRRRSSRLSLTTEPDWTRRVVGSLWTSRRDHGDDPTRINGQRRGDFNRTPATTRIDIRGTSLFQVAPIRTITHHDGRSNFHQFIVDRVFDTARLALTKPDDAYPSFFARSGMIDWMEEIETTAFVAGGDDIGDIRWSWAD